MRLLPLPAFRESARSSWSWRLPRSDADQQFRRAALPELLKDFDVIHLCGKMDESLNGTEGYRSTNISKKELPDLFALADLVISRAGANAICEISTLHKPNLLIPLSAKASRSDQILNAQSFKRGASPRHPGRGTVHSFLTNAVKEL